MRSMHVSTWKMHGLYAAGGSGREDAYSYELQYSRYFEEEVTIRNGDVVAATCMYNSMDRAEATPGGLASQEEMCINFLLVYPATCCASRHPSAT